MLQTETSKTREKTFNSYRKDISSGKYLINKQLEWLIEEGNIRESIYFKGFILYKIVIITVQSLVNE